MSENNIKVQLAIPMAAALGREDLCLLAQLALSSLNFERRPPAPLLAK
jgi:hypothetical protein